MQKVPSHFYNQDGSYKSNSERQYTDEGIQRKVDETHTDGKYTVLKRYWKNSESRLSVRHEVCGYEYSVSMSNFIYGNSGRRPTKCPKCAGHKQYTLNDIIAKIESITGNEYTIIDSREKDIFIKNNEKFLIRHNKCNHKYLVCYDKFFSGRRCPNCINYKNEKIIQGYLEANDIVFERNKKFPGLVNKLPLHCDFYISSMNLIIEYDGEFHYSQRFDKESFESQLMSDNIKDNFAKDNNINLLRIPYWQRTNITRILDESVKSLSSNKKLYLPKADLEEHPNLKTFISLIKQ